MRFIQKSIDFVHLVLFVNDKCKKCKTCMKLGCPAISIKDSKIVIDKNQCVGCGLCLNVCPFDAIEKEDK